MKSNRKFEQKLNSACFKKRHNKVQQYKQYFYKFLPKQPKVTLFEFC